jgi:hypothetical protein
LFFLLLLCVRDMILFGFVFLEVFVEREGGVRRVGGLKEKRLMVKERFYNGVTLEQIHGEGFEKGNTTRDGRSKVLGIQGSCCLSLCSLEHFISPST